MLFPLSSSSYLSSLLFDGHPTTHDFRVLKSFRISRIKKFHSVLRDIRKVASTPCTSYPNTSFSHSARQGLPCRLSLKAIFFFPAQTFYEIAAFINGFKFNSPLSKMIPSLILQCWFYSCKHSTSYRAFLNQQRKKFWIWFELAYENSRFFSRLAACGRFSRRNLAKRPWWRGARRNGCFRRLDLSPMHEVCISSYWYSYWYSICRRCCNLTSAIC